MKFRESALQGAYIIELEAFEDERGFFGRTFCSEEFKKAGLEFRVVQANFSFNEKKGTLRGMHYQAEPYGEAKLVQCVAGALYDVIVDLRESSETYCRYLAVELSAANRRLLYVPEGFAHGFQTLEDKTSVYYLMSESYRQEYARGVRWNDPAFGIEWPFEEPVISEKDRNLPDFKR